MSRCPFFVGPGGKKKTAMNQDGEKEVEGRGKRESAFSWTEDEKERGGGKRGKPGCLPHNDSMGPSLFHRKRRGGGKTKQPRSSEVHTMLPLPLRA